MFGFFPDPFPIPNHGSWQFHRSQFAIIMTFILHLQANFLQLLLSTALQLLAGLCVGILLFCSLGYFCLQSIDGRLIRIETTLHFLQLSRPFLVLMLTLLASLFILLIIVVLCVQVCVYVFFMFFTSTFPVLLIHTHHAQHCFRFAFSLQTIYCIKILVPSILFPLLLFFFETLALIHLLIYVELASLGNYFPAESAAQNF